MCRGGGNCCGFYSCGTEQMEEGGGGGSAHADGGPGTSTEGTARGLAGWGLPRLEENELKL